MEVIWWTFFIHTFFLLLGGPGEAYVESRGTKVLWRSYHTREQGKTIMTI